ncbi:MAG TPA: TIGR03750 family conjugal transfer protein, partial [Alicycliphilus sp.]|nr:TIGR03750 family conjugal transfer protein [Alicycliphilus sp.]
MSTRSRSQAAADAEAVRHKAPVTDRVNVEPSILNGMNMPEAQVIGAVSLVVFLIIGGLVFSVTRLWQVWLLLSLIGPTLALWFGSLYLARIKRGRPDAYYTQAIHLWLAQRSLVKPRFITYQGWWSLG